MVKDSRTVDNKENFNERRKRQRAANGVSGDGASLSRESCSNERMEVAAMHHYSDDGNADSIDK